MKKLLVDDTDTFELNFVLDVTNLVVHPAGTEVEDGVETFQLKTLWNKLCFGIKTLIDGEAFVVTTTSGKEPNVQFDGLRHQLAHLRYCLKEWNLNEIDPGTTLSREKVERIEGFYRLKDSCFQKLCRLPAQILDPILGAAVEKLRMSEDTRKKLSPPQEPYSAQTVSTEGTSSTPR